MRCKKHISDFSSNIGICASCLRERLSYLIEAQAQAEAEAQAQTQPQSRLREGCQSHHSATVQSTTHSHLPHHQPSRFDDRHRNPNPPPPLVFPRSVSPYISRRKSEKTFGGSGGAVDESPIHHRMFFSTPQLGPTYRTNDINFKEEAEVEGTNKNKNKKKKKWSKFPVISDLLRFRSRWRKSNHHHTPITDPIPRVSSQPIPSTSDAASSSSSSTWMSNLLNQDGGGGGGGGSVPRRKNQKSIVRMFSLDEAAASRRERRRIFQKDRGMSPDLDQENDDDDEELARDHHPETPEHWRRTPTSTILRTSQGRFRASPGRSSFGSVANGWGLCLSPLVRASPVNRPWNGGGCGVLTSSGQESVGYSGEIRPSSSTMTGKPHLSTNRSRKIADFGRFNHNR